jgi:plasmid stabilization system protein ParE
MKTFFVHDSAEIEINEAVNFYDFESFGLGKIFLDELTKAVKRISDFPEVAPILKDGVRRLSMSKFPYSLLYSIKEDEIRLLAVAHQRKRPFYWKKRR